jgi:hypothetical protein
MVRVQPVGSHVVHKKRREIKKAAHSQHYIRDRKADLS